MTKSINRINERFGRLVVIDQYRENGKTIAVCICDCGNHCNVGLRHLVDGGTASCGCYRKEHCSQVGGQHGGYISEKHYELMRQRQMGSGNSCWRGGKTTEAQRIRTSDEYDEWRKSVFERDNYTCQKCLKRGGKLAAHHKKSFSKFPENRLDIDNGITLCDECHKQTDNFGYKALINNGG